MINDAFLAEYFEVKRRKAVKFMPGQPLDTNVLRKVVFIRESGCRHTCSGVRIGFVNGFENRSANT